MEHKQIKLSVRVNLADSPGEFYSMKSAENIVQGILTNAIPERNPIVRIKQVKQDKRRSHKKRKYEAKDFLVDSLMVCLTGGLWIIWIVIRERGLAE